MIRLIPAKIKKIIGTLTIFAILPHGRPKKKQPAGKGKQMVSVPILLEIVTDSACAWLEVTLPVGCCFLISSP